MDMKRVGDTDKNLQLSAHRLGLSYYGLQLDDFFDQDDTWKLLGTRRFRLRAPQRQGREARGAQRDRKARTPPPTPTNR